MVELAYRYFGGEGKPPLVVLHGLMGSSRNWQSVCGRLIGSFEVFALDLRGHGESPHRAPYDHRELARDVLGFLDRQGIADAVLVGHSLGGKVAMKLACCVPERVRSLVVVDIAPRAYAPHHAADLDALAGLDLAALAGRSEAEHALASAIPDWALRRFLLTNLARGDDGRFRWQCDLAGLRRHLPELAGDSLPDGARYPGRACFVRGGRSAFVLDEDREAIATHFPDFDLVTLPAAGHNVHHDAPDDFLAVLRDFLRQENPPPSAAGLP